ncbi:dihydrolipoamide acetyltransferase family protein [Pseudonocardia humida]|uniref:Dihydrolipoamide acetyltransferase component of pyruvate dehydrogenase complex n=1 Tax=Pseudonocardia humida TaxID=2800819 RepID=A0ABT1A6I9_9PSEU|nr:dihydrolipoamide acetyltransferase family protein [Pseudonocardia humida]MCO1658632.1 2-oxo acid dehydrogenase subunit E2 [Pseudonocardia humida]
MSRRVFTLPDLGEGLTEADLVRWLVAVGDAVEVDAPVAEVETAKAVVEVPTPYAGTIAELHGEEGATLAVGAPLVSVEDGADAGADPGELDPAAEAYRREERAGSGNVLVGYGTVEAPLRSRRRRAAARPQPAPQRGAERPAVKSPIVRKLARSHGIDLAALTGSGPGGLIVRGDVEAAIAAARPPAPPQARDAPDAGADRDARTGLPVRARVPLTGGRRTTAAALTRSRREVPEATTWVDVDATALLEFRAALADDRPRPGVLAVVARFAVAGLAAFPALNSRFDPDRGEVVELDGVNLGIAAQTDRGLLVPAVRGAHRLGMRALDAEIRRLTAAARDGSATAAELTGGSFTLNNYGVLGVDGSAAIVNHPEVAILGLGRILARPWVVRGEVVPRSITQLSLVFDHRVCDGGTAAGFLRFVADAIEDPLSALAEL